MDGRPHIRSVTGVDAIRTLRAELLGLVAAADVEPNGIQVLCLSAPRMTEERIAKEWDLLQQALRPEVGRRLAVRVLHADGRARSFGLVPDSMAVQLCSDSSPVERRSSTRLPRPDYSFIVLKLLVYGWLTHKGPLTTLWIAKAAGCSYPTVASALRRLGKAVRRHKDRRVELLEFPREEWGRLLLTADAARSTLRYADRSGQPRSAASLADRLRALHPENVAPGGVLAARHYHPELDLMGLPRLDLCVHSPGRWPDLSFVRRLDPALEATPNPAEPARLIVHFVRHAKSLFLEGPDGLAWADPVECLLDLHEARLEPQAGAPQRASRARPGETLSTVSPREVLARVAAAMPLSVGVMSGALSPAAPGAACEPSWRARTTSKRPESPATPGCSHGSQ